MSAAAKRIFAVQAASAEAERHFSVAGRIMVPERARLSADVVEALLVIFHDIKRALENAAS